MSTAEIDNSGIGAFRGLLADGVELHPVAFECPASVLPPGEVSVEVGEAALGKLHDAETIHDYGSIEASLHDRPTHFRVDEDLSSAVNTQNAQVNSGQTSGCTGVYVHRPEENIRSLPAPSAPTSFR